MYFKGIHWVALFRVEKCTYEYFDSLGSDITFMKNVLKLNGTVEYTTSQLQSDDSESCGMFVVYYLLQRVYNFDLNYQELLNSLFSENCSENQKTIESFAKSF